MVAASEIFFENRPRHTQKILLDPGRRMNRLSGDLFGAPSHICTTSIESKTRGGGIERD
jgi:hypothetical protein